MIITIVGLTMSILISGDFHANSLNEIDIISKHSLLCKYREEIYDTIKYHIILGDGGFFWPENQKADKSNYKELAKRPFPILCLIGNHEPILGMKKLNEVNIGIGETVFLIQNNPFIAYLKRGKVYTIEGFKVLVLGGALSIDKNARIPGITWWEQEYWSENEKHDLFALLESVNSFDYVLSHTGPHRINSYLFKMNMHFNQSKFNDEVAFLNDIIDSKISCLEWLCGHWHKDVYFYDQNMKRGYQYLYHTTKILNKDNL